MEAASRRTRARGLDKEKVLELLEHTAREVARAAEIVQQVRGFRRSDGSGFDPVDVRSIVRDAVELLGLQVESRGLEFHLRLPGDALSVRCDPVRAQQACMNLLQNAVDGVGTIAIEAHAVDAFVEIEIRDEGVGIEPENRSRVFESFVTTKAGGLGLGLPISRRTAEAYGGTVSIGAREDGKPGTVARLRLPREESRDGS